MRMSSIVRSIPWKTHIDNGCTHPFIQIKFLGSLPSESSIVSRRGCDVKHGQLIRVRRQFIVRGWNEIAGDDDDLGLKGGGLEASAVTLMGDCAGGRGYG
jgi:hypothetical protein